MCLYFIDPWSCTMKLSWYLPHAELQYGKGGSSEVGFKTPTGCIKDFLEFSAIVSVLVHFEDPHVDTQLLLELLQQLFPAGPLWDQLEGLLVLPQTSHQGEAKTWAGVSELSFPWSDRSAQSTGSSPNALLLLWPQRTAAVFELHSQLGRTLWVTGKFNAFSALSGNCAQGPRSHNRNLQLPSHELHKGQRKRLPIRLTGLLSSSQPIF